MPPTARKTALFIEAEKLRMAQAFDQAIPLYRQILQEDAGDAEVRKTLAGLYLITGDKQQGLSEYMMLVALALQEGDLDHAESLLKRVRNLDREGRFKEKIAGLIDGIARARAPRSSATPAGPAPVAPPPPPPASAISFSMGDERLPTTAAPATDDAADDAAVEIDAIVAEEELDEPPTDITEEDLALAEEELERDARDASSSSATLANALFSALPPAALNAVIRACEKVSFPAGAVIFEEGATTRSIFIVGQGIVEVRASKEGGKGHVGVAKLGPGELFGEMAFLTGSRREAAVVADTDTLCYSLSQQEAASLMEAHPEFREVAIELYKERVVRLFIATSSLLSGLPEAAKEAVLGAFEHLRVRAGHTLLKEGSRGDDLFFVKSGELRVVTSKDGTELELARVGKHHLIGEISFLTRAPRTASVVASEQAEVLRLTGDRLRRIVEEHPRLGDALREVQVSHAMAAAHRLLGKD